MPRPSGVDAAVGPTPLNDSYHRSPDAHAKPDAEPGAGGETTHLALLTSTFAIAVCGLVYELLAGTVSSYLLGDSVYQFSIVIGLFMAAMGFGSYLSRFVTEHLTDAFVWTQISIGLVGGLSAPILFFAFSHLENYEPFLVVTCLLIGALIGVEIPLIIRLLRDYRILKLNVSNVLTVDYIGALLASLLFPLVLVPHLGLLRTALFFGLLNTFVAGIALYTFRGAIGSLRTATITALGVAGVLLAGFIFADRISETINQRLYSGEIIHSQTTPYQTIVLTRSRGVLNLFINGALQFSSLDEYRYHESLVHPALALARHRERVLILGGGDGLAAREVLKHPGVHSVSLVDIDPAVTTLFKTNALLREQNADALNDPRVHIYNADAAKFLEQTKDIFDVVILDLPDPHDIGISRLYTRWFYGLIRSRMAVYGLLATQATSPLYAREAFWCIEHTIASTDFPIRDQPLYTLPYHTYVPTFGDWGFILASARPLRVEDIQLEVPARYLNQDTLRRATLFPPDSAKVATAVNTLEDHPLPGYYEAGWARWYR